jgi:hypothetical protein
MTEQSLIAKECDSVYIYYMTTVGISEGKKGRKSTTGDLSHYGSKLACVVVPPHDYCDSKVERGKEGRKGGTRVNNWKSLTISICRRTWQRSDDGVLPHGICFSSETVEGGKGKKQCGLTIESLPYHVSGLAYLIILRL